MSKESKKKDNIDCFIQKTLQNIRNLIDANVIVGNVINAGKFTVIPINKVTVGYITGGGEISNKKSPQYSVGSTSGFNITPMGFIFVNDDNATFVSAQPHSTNEKILEVIYKIINKKLNEDKNKGEEQSEV